MTKELMERRKKTIEIVTRMLQERGITIEPDTISDAYLSYGDDEFRIHIQGWISMNRKLDALHEKNVACNGD